MSSAAELAALKLCINHVFFRCRLKRTWCSAAGATCARALIAFDGQAEDKWTHEVERLATELGSVLLGKIADLFVGHTITKRSKIIDSVGGRTANIGVRGKPAMDFDPSAGPKVSPVFEV